jgi:urease accessory protein
LRLVFERRGGQTVLTGRRSTLPLQALEPSRLPDGSLYLMLLNPTGGIFGGDWLRTEVVLGAGTHVILTTPSASKIYRALNHAALCETQISLGEGAIVEYLPDHLIPHPGAAIRQNLGITMAPGSCAIVYDAIAAGRIGREERLRFREIVSEISICFDNLPRFLSRSSLIPVNAGLDGRGLMEGFNYLGSIIAMRHETAATVGDVKAIDGVLCAIPGIRGGASALATGGLVAKFLTPTADALARAKFSTWSVVREKMIGRSEFDLRKL